MRCLSASSTSARTRHATSHASASLTCRRWSASSSARLLSSISASSSCARCAPLPPVFFAASSSAFSSSFSVSNLFSAACSALALRSPFSITRPAGSLLELRLHLR